MTDYEFTLKFALPPNEADPHGHLAALEAAGCTDALVGLGVPGRIALDFSREADSATEAMMSALRDVRRAIPDARLIEATPDLVGLSDVADIVQCSRQNMRSLHIAHRHSFPLPVHEASAVTLYHLASVLRWLVECQRKPIDPSLIEVAEVAMQINAAKEAAFVSSTPQRMEVPRRPRMDDLLPLVG